MVVNAETFIGKDEGVQAQRAIRNQQRIQKATTNNNYYEWINWSRCNQIDEAKRLRNYRCVWCVVRINILESVQRSLLRQPAHALTLTAQHFFVCFVMILYFQLINWVSFVLFLIFFFSSFGCLKLIWPSRAEMNFWPARTPQSMIYAKYI